MLRPDRSTRRASAARAWVEHAALFAAVAALLANYSLLLAGPGWWVAACLVVGVVSLACAVLRSLGRRWVAPWALLLLVVALSWIFVPSTLVVGVPTPASISALVRLAEQSTRIIVEEPAPAGATPPVVLVLAASTGLVIVLADVLLRRRHGALLLGIPLVVLYAIPPMVAGVRPALWPFLVASAAWLVLVWRPTRRDRRSMVPAALLGAGAIVGAVVVPPALPDVSAVSRTFGDPTPQVFGRGINPMLQLGQNLRRGSTVTAAEYTTTLTQPPYLRVAMLQDFTGRTWRPSRDGGGAQFESASTIDDSIEVADARTSIQIRDLRSSMLPVPYPAQDVEGLTGDWFWQRAGRTIRSNDATTSGQSYTIQSLDRRPTAEQMRGLQQNSAGTDPALSDYLSLPAQRPASLERTAREATSGASNDYDRALALQDYLRDGDFTYSDTTPVSQDFDGNGLDALDEFLKVKQGYCIHFSSAMAVMARELGIPSRVVVGYAPGRATSVENRQTVYEVTSDDLHAWPELYFPGAGWINFEPTPSIGQETAFDEPTQGPNADAESQSPESQATPEQQDQTDVADSATSAGGSNVGPAAGFAGLLALLVLGLPAMVRRGLRWRRLGAGRAVGDHWREVEATATDVGVGLPLAGSPAQAASRLADVSEVPPESLERLLGAVELARYGRPGRTPQGTHDDAVAVVAGLEASVPRRRRLRAWLAPRSLVASERVGRRAVAEG